MKYKIFALMVVFVCIMLSGCKPAKKNSELKNTPQQIVLSQEQEKNIDLKTEIASVRKLVLKITIPAQFKTRAQSLDRIYSPIEGKVTKVFVEHGQFVKVGAPLVEIYSDHIGQIQLEFLDKVIELDSEIKQNQAMYELSMSNYKREMTLFNEKITSRQEYESARAQMQKDKVRLDSLRIKRATIVNVYQQRLALYGGGNIQQVLANKKISPNITLRANKSGIITERKINPGEFVESNREMFNISDLSMIWLVGYAFEKDAPHLRVNQRIKALLEESNNKYVEGVISYVSPLLDSETKTLEVRADIDNKNLEIKPNMYAQMIVDTGEIEVLSVPKTAVENYGDYKFVFVKTALHSYEQRKVQIHKESDDYFEVSNGVKEGEEVVSRGTFALMGEALKLEQSN